MKIGTDVSLKTCKEEGYLIMEFKKKELLNKDGTVKTDVYARFYAHLPEYCLDSGLNFDDEGRIISSIYLDVRLCWDDLMEMFDRHAAGIASMTGLTEAEYRQSITPTVSCMLNLASDINAYRGLE